MHLIHLQQSEEQSEIVLSENSIINLVFLKQWFYIINIHHGPITILIYKLVLNLIKAFLKLISINFLLKNRVLSYGMSRYPRLNRSILKVVVEHVMLNSLYFAGLCIELIIYILAVPIANVHKQFPKKSYNPHYMLGEKNPKQLYLAMSYVLEKRIKLKKERRDFKSFTYQSFTYYAIHYKDNLNTL